MKLKHRISNAWHGAVAGWKGVRPPTPPGARFRIRVVDEGEGRMLSNGLFFTPVSAYHPLIQVLHNEIGEFADQRIILENDPVPEEEKYPVLKIKVIEGLWVATMPGFIPPSKYPDGVELKQGEIGIYKRNRLIVEEQNG